MSDTKDNMSLKARQMQQRQILAMMGISQWIQPNSLTMRMADIALPEIALGNDSYDINVPVLKTEPVILESYPNALYSEPYSTPQTQSPVTTSDDVYNEQTVEKSYRIDTLSEVSPSVEPITANVDRDEANDTQAIIAPFDLQGGRYGNWVLLVNIQALNNDSQKLWQNIVQALSISCETSSFPICEGMDTAELANASLAGYIFKLSRYEDIRVAALTALPEGLTHPNVIKMPTLSDMLVDTSLKQQLWETLSN